MRLKRLELFGFKSFADRTVMSFEHDLVGIVGPNGCGKSNVVDAARWVLGEQRPTSMRGTEMVDVIFKGSASRTALSVAEVTVVIDNAAGTLEGRGPEVSVTRRVYRTGEGEYLIDGERVRLKDVREMLFGTGLGSRGYSVLEQGKIDAVLSANPLDRRVIFEEAAGVSRYRQRRKEAESRLKRVEADVLRLDDLVGELKTRERSLKIQAGRARRYTAARDEWKVEGLRLARHEAQHLAQSIATFGRELGELEALAEEKRERRGAAEADIGTREDEQNTLSNEVERLSGDSAELAAEIRAMDERRSQLAARIEAWEAAAQEEGDRAVTLKERHTERSAEAEALDTEIERIADAVEEANDRVRLLAEAAAELAGQYQAACEAFDAQNERVLALLHEETSAKNQVEHLEQTLPLLDERIERAAGRRAQERGEADSLRASRAEAATLLTESGEQLLSEEGELERLEQEAQRVGERLSALEGMRSELGLERARVSSRMDALRTWEEEGEGALASVAELTEALEQGAGPALARELGGLVADRIRSQTEWARALDAALGEAAGALVVEEPFDALRILTWFKQRERGRIALAFPQGEKPFRVSDAVLAGNGVRGKLLDFVEVKPGFEELAFGLLGDVVCVESVERGLQLAAQHPELRFVTAAGDLVGQGEVRGGHVELVQGPVGRRSLRSELEAEAERLSVELARTVEQIEAIRGGEAERTVQAAARRTAILELREGRADAKRGLEEVSSRLEEMAGTVELTESECRALEDERSRALDELSAARTTLVEIEQSFGGEKARLTELEEHRKALEAERNQRARDEGQARVEVTELVERRTALIRRRTDLAGSIDELLTELARSERLQRDHRENAERGTEGRDRLAGDRDGMLSRRGELEERVAVLREKERRGRDAIDESRRRGDAITGELEELSERLTEAKLEKQKLELQRDEVGRRAEEDFGMAPLALLEGFVPDPELDDDEALAGLSARVHGLKEELEKLGPVNVEAVEELDGVSERLEFLLEQRGDLDDARRSLESTLRKLNAESERRFLETFDAIREEFQTLFRQLFGGGRADIALAEGESVLEAGIEITARPPGREALPITLLSGGQRTLTALALLFAVFRTNPSPFCILDEVDAALDDANIGRFLTLLEHDLGKTQYIVVTHNKGTMAACQMLYGVTMAVRGVSHVVSVELDEVDEFVPEATGSGRRVTESGQETEATLQPAAAPEPAEPDREGPPGPSGGELVPEPASRHP